ncbi:MAG: hypothetical protein ACJ8FD_09230 [Bradyrhizobium canariense]|jgi:hypothetical protein
MDSIRPDTTEPMPLRRVPVGVGTLIVRFVALLVLAVLVMTLIWSS